MYKIERNKETGKLVLKKVILNVHPSIIDCKMFDDVFTRETARFEYLSLLAKQNRGEATTEDKEKLAALDAAEYTFSILEAETSYNGLHEALKPIMVLALFATGRLIKSYDMEEDKIKALRITLQLSDLYKACSELIPSIETGAATIEEAVQAIKPLYNEAVTRLINHDAVEGICKKWAVSTKEKMTRCFVLGLLSDYKLLRSLKIKKDSPLKSQASFEKYVAMWVVSDGNMVEKKDKEKKTAVVFSDYAR